MVKPTTMLYRNFLAMETEELLRSHPIDGAVLGLWDLVGRVSGHVDRLRRLHLPTAGKTEAILRDHRAIARAIEAQDPAAAQTALRKHLSGTLSAVNEICRQYPDYVC
jgi:DNA-binding GntR family transcriptional regulator